ncbi:sugar phosphate isomerase/epimerase, partial [Paenibacillus sp. 28ISP30-2]|nr:sugar phosphate isomerase/epimerase [Paenibacillus sp. 28ISP30-2]
MNANLGIRAHDIENVPLQEAVNIISSKGLTSVQLAVSKSLNDINTKLGSFSPGIAHYISSIFRKKDVQIAVLGCYINMIHPDPSQRRKELDR